MQQPSGCCNVYTGKTDRYEGKGMEMFDIRTPEGEPTGEVKERSAVTGTATGTGQPISGWCAGRMGKLRCFCRSAAG